MNELHEKNLISTKEASSLSGYASDYLSRLCREGKIKGTRFGRAWFIDKNSLEEFVSAQIDRKIELAESLAQQREEEYRKANSVGSESRGFAQMENSTRAAVNSIISTFTSPRFLDSKHRAPAPVFASVATALLLAASVSFVGTGYAASLGEKFATGALNTRANIIALVSSYEPEAIGSDSLAKKIDVIAIHDSAVLAASGSPVESLPSDFNELGVEALAEVNPSALTYARAEEVRSSLPTPVTAEELAAGVGYAAAHPGETFVNLTSSAMRAYAHIGVLALSDIETAQRMHERAVYSASDALISFGSYVRDAAVTVPATIGTSYLATLESSLSSYEEAVYAFAEASQVLPNVIVSSTYAVGDSAANATAFLVVTAPVAYSDSASAFAGFAGSMAEEVSGKSFAFGALSREVVGESLRLQDEFIAGSVGRTKATLASGVSGVQLLPGSIANEALGLVGNAALAIETFDTSALSATPLAALDLDRFIPGFLKNATAVLARAFESALHGVFGPLAGFFGATEEAGLAIIPTENLGGSSNEEGEGDEPSVVYNGPVTIIRNEYPTERYGGVPQSYVDERFEFLRRTLYNRIEDVADDDRFRGEITKSTIIDSDMQGGTITGTAITDSSFTGGTISGSSLNVASTTISGELVVSGDAEISGAVTASYFTATSTTDASTFPNLVATNATATNATTTNFFASALRATMATITDAFFTNITAALATLTDAVITNLTATNSTFTNATTTNATSTNLYATNAILGSATSTNLYASSARIVSGVIDTLTAPIANLTTAIITTLTATDATLTNATTTNATSTGSLALTYTTANRLLQLNAAGGVIATNLSSWIAGTANQITVTDTGSGGVSLSLPSQIIYGSSEQTTLASGGATSTFGGGLFAYALQARDYIAGPYILATSTTATSAFSGNIAVGRNTTLGTSASDALVVNANVSSNFVPSANNTYNLGSVSNGWRTIYVDEVVANNLSAASTSIAGTVSETFTINSDNGTADTEDMSIVFNRGSASPNALLTWNSTADRFEFNMPIYSASGTIANASTTALTVAGQANIGSLAGAAVSSLTTNYLAKWNNGTFINSLIYDSGSAVGIGTSTPAVSFDIFGTDALRLPTGTTAQRPTGDVGYVRYNLTTHQFEGFGDNGVWQGLGGVIDADQDTYITADTNNTDEDTLRLFTAGTERLTILPGGNIGIGTTTPGQTLSVAGTGLFSGLATFMSGFNIGTNTFTSLLGNGLINDSGTLSVSTSSLASGFFQQGGNSFGTTATLGTNDSQNLALETGGTTRLTIDTSGNVGIGTTSPSELFSVGGRAVFDSSIRAGVAADGRYSHFGGTSTTFNPTQGSGTDVGVFVNTSSVASSAHLRAMYGIAEWNSPTDATGRITGVSGRALATGAGNLTYTSQGGAVVGGTFYAMANGSTAANITRASGVFGQVNIVGSHTATEATSIYAGQPQLSTTITDFAGFRVQGGILGAGVVTNRYGLYIEDLVSGTNRYGIYQSGASDANYFAGNVGIGTTTPGQTLSVAGTGLFSGNVSVAGLTASGTVTGTNFIGTSAAATSTFAGGFASPYILADRSAAGDVSGTWFVGSNDNQATGFVISSEFSGTNHYFNKITSLASTNQSTARGRSLLIDASTGAVDTATNGTTNAAVMINARSNSGSLVSGALFGVYNNSVEQLAVLPTGARLTGSLTTTGSVGIGTSTPSSLLQVVSSGGFTASAQTVASFVRNGSTATDSIISVIAGNAAKSIIRLGDTDNESMGLIKYDHALNALAFGTNGVNDLVNITSAGNVGIGTTSPGQTLSVAGTGLFSGLTTFMSGFNIGSNTFTSLLGNGLINDSGSLAISTSSLASGFFQQGGNSFGATATLGTNDANNLAFETNGSTRMTIDTSGNVGIGTSTPGQLLAVAGNTYLTGGLGVGLTNTTAGSIYATGNIQTNAGLINSFIGQSSFNGYNPSDNGARSGITASNSFYIQLDSNNDQTDRVFAVNTNSSNLSGGAELFRVQENGNVGIGTTSPSYALAVAGDINATGKYRVNGTQMVYLPGGNFSGTSYYGDGGGSLSYVSGNDGRWNTGVGVGALMFNTTGSFNSALGYNALEDNTTGSTNVAMGSNALFQNTTGSNNTAVGYNALGTSLTNSSTVGIGVQAGLNVTADSAVFIGHQSGRAASTYTNTGATGVGFQALYTGTGNYSTALGYRAGFLSTGATNLFLGYQAADNATTGANNIVIGSNIDVPSATGSNQLNIGNLIFGTGVSGTGTTIAGNIGIGTTTPGQTFSVAGTGLFSGLTTFESGFNIGSNTFTSLLGNGLINDSGTLTVSTSSLASGFFQQGGNSFGATATLGTNDANNLEFETGGTTRLTINTSGNIGIGTTTPAFPLVVNATAGTNQEILRVSQNSSSRTVGIGIDDAGSNFGISLYEQGAKKFVVESNYGALIGQTYINAGTNAPANGLLVEGNVGIGSTTPSEKLVVTSGSVRLNNIVAGQGIYADNTVSNMFSFTRQNTVATGDLSITGFGGIGLTGGHTTYGSGVASGYSLYVASGGNIGIGSTTPLGKLSVQTGTSGDGIYLKSTNSSSNVVFRLYNDTGTYNQMFTARSGSGTDAGKFFLSVNNGTTNAFVADTVGNIGLGTNAPATRLALSGTSAQTMRFTNTTSLTTTGGTDELGRIDFEGNRSGLARQAAFIRARQDGTWSAVTVTQAPAALEFFTNGSDTSVSGTTSPRMTITSAGSVGIATSSPSARLHVAVTDATSPFIAERTGGNAVKFQVTVGGNDLGLIQNPLGQSWISGAVSGSGYTISESNAFGTNDRFVIARTTGNVGIGTTTPYAGLSISRGSGTSASADTILSLNTSTNVERFRFSGDGVMQWGVLAANGILSWDTNLAVVGGSTGNALSLRANNTDAVRITTAGNVGIGVTDPAYQLEVGKSTGGTVAISTAGIAGTVASPLYATLNFLGYADKVKGSITVDDREGNVFGGQMAFSVRDSADALQTRMFINSAGQVGIGTTNPGGDGVKSFNRVLDIGSVTNNDLIGLQLKVIEGSNNRRVGLFLDESSGVYGFDSTASSGVLPFVIQSAGSEQLRVAADGNVGIGNNNPSYKLTVSDSNADGIAGRFAAGGTGSPFGIAATATGAATLNTAGYFQASNATTNIGVNVDVASGANNYAIYSSNTAKSYFAGNVGIGDDSPAALLTVGSGDLFQVDSSGRIGTAANVDLVLDSGLSADKNRILIGNDDFMEFQAGAAVRGGISALNNGLSLYGGTTEASHLFVNSSGNVGIGETSPLSLLHLQGNGGFRIDAAENTIRVNLTYDDATGAVLSMRGGGGSPAAVISADAGSSSYFTASNVGIGTTSPAALLEASTNQNGSTYIRVTNASTGAAARAGVEFVNDTGSQIGYVGAHGSGTAAGIGFANHMVVYGTNAAGIADIAANASGIWRVLTGGTSSSNERMRITSTGNVGIGTLSPQSLFVVGGTQTGNAGLEIVPGSGIIAQAYNRTTSAYSALNIDASSIGFRPNGSTMMTVNTAGVGIGTATVADRLTVEVATNKRIGVEEVTSSAITDFSTGAASIQFSRPSDGANNLNGIFTYASGGGLVNFALAARDDIVFATGGGAAYTNSPERMRITAAGNVGIGTTTPRGVFDVSAGVNAFAYIGGNSAGHRSVRIGQDSSGYATIQGVDASVVGTARDLTLQATGGNLGVGTTTPSIKFTSFVSGNWSGSFGDTSAAVGIGSVSGVAQIQGAGNTTLTSTAALSLNANGGNVGIGTASPQALLDISGTVSGTATTTLRISGLKNDNAWTAGQAAGSIDFYNNDASGSAGAGVRGFMRSITENTNGTNWALTFGTVSNNAAPAERLRIDSSGFVGIAMTNPSVALDVTGDIEYTGTITDVSDRRLKENIEDINGALSILSGIRGTTYNMIGSNRPEVGFIAQEVQAVLPNTAKVIDPSNGYLGVSYLDFIPYLVEGVNDLNIRTLSLAPAAENQEAHSLAVSADASVAGMLTVSGTGTFEDKVTATAFLAANTSALPSEVLTAGQADLYKMGSYAITNIQSLKERADLLATRIDDVETRVAALEAQQGQATAVDGAVGLTLATLTNLLQTVGIYIENGVAQFETLVFRQLAVAKDTNGDSSAGSQTIYGGNTVAEVQNPYVLPTSKIFVTFTGPVSGAWYISHKEAGSFRVTLDQPQASDVSFDYFILQTEGQLASPGAAAPQQQTTEVPTPNPAPQPLTPVFPGTTGGAPTITLNGQAARTLSVGAPWSDPGATASDETDGDLTASIQVTGSVDTATPGVYTISYSVSDSEGNEAHVSRIVTVEASTPTPTPAPEPAPAPAPEPAPAPAPEPAPAPAPEPAPAPAPEPAPAPAPAPAA